MQDVRNVFDAILKYGHDEDFAPSVTDEFDPTDAPAGSMSKIQLMRMRVESGLPLWHEGDPIFTIWQPLIGCMFLGLYLGSVRWFLSTFPAMQIWQPMQDPETLEAELVASD